MNIPLVKMHGTGNDFIVLDETRTHYGLQAAHYRWLAHRHFGVGADQILTVRRASRPDVDFDYLIHNADGSPAGQCGNGARCFVRFVHEQGLSDKNPLWVQAPGMRLCLTALTDGQVRVDMGAPRLDPAAIPFSAEHATVLETIASFTTWQIADQPFWTLSMGNPHAVVLVDDVAQAPLERIGRTLQTHAAFPEGVNVGALQIQSRHHVKLRVYERGAGETLACGTGACAAVATGILAQRLDSPVHVDMPGGRLVVDWPRADSDRDPAQSIFLQGPVATVFRATVEVPPLGLA